MKMEPIQCSEMSAYKIQMPGNYPEDNILQPQHWRKFEKYPVLFTVCVTLETQHF
jgi:hypothetical protein